jgi:hypothetical protein
MLSAGAGCVTADQAPAAAETSTHRRAPTAWAFIESRPELRNIAHILEFTGYRDILSAPFGGTLLLPTNDVSAWARQQLQQHTHRTYSL